MKEKKEKIKHYNQIASERDCWRLKNRFYHEKIVNLLSFLVPKNSTVLEIGCGTGDLIVALEPELGVGIDFAEQMIEQAEKKYASTHYPQVTFKVDDIEKLNTQGIFSHIIISDVMGDLNDTWQAFRNLQQVSDENTRLIVTYYNAMWEPILNLAEKTGLKMPQPQQNWLSAGDIQNLLELNGFEVIKQGQELLLPKKVPLLSALFNTFLGNLPIFQNFGLTNYMVARKVPNLKETDQDLSVSVLIPCRNEKGNIRAAIERTPNMGTHTEILFVDGNSNDGTVTEIEKVIADFPDKDIKLIHQVPPNSNLGSDNGLMLSLGKGDAVRKGFEAANGDVLMILDADLTVPPEELPRFYTALIEGKGDLINGTRLVYPMEKEAMRFLNVLGNKFFSLLFSWILGQRIKDTLCGTKVLSKKDYKKIAANRSFFGDFDPFGDFDLLFGAAKQNLKIVEIPVHYKERTYGEIKIERFKHGLILLKMSIFALFKLKFR